MDCNQFCNHGKPLARALMSSEHCEMVPRAGQ